MIVMTPFEVEKRLYRCPHLRQADLDAFLGAGVPPEALCVPDQPARAKIGYVAGGCVFEFAEGSNARWAFIFLARDEFGEGIDLIAWIPRCRLLAQWRGIAGVLGGENVFGPRLDAGAALRIHASPLEWLKDCRRGVVIVDEDLAGDLLRFAGPLEVQAESDARRLRTTLARPAPRIVLVRHNRAGAA